MPRSCPSSPTFAIKIRSGVRPFILYILPADRANLSRMLRPDPLPIHLLGDEDAGGEGLVAELPLHDDRLDDLEEGDDVAVLDDVAGGLLGGGDAPGLVLLVEDRV